MTRIHPTAIVASGSELDSDVEVGAHAVIESDVSIASGTIVMAHAHISQFSRIGKNFSRDPVSPHVSAHAS